MQVKIATDNPPATSRTAVPLGSGRLQALLTGTGPELALALRHAAADQLLATADLALELPPADSWQAELNAEMAIVTEQFTCNDRRLVRETIAHFKLDLIVVRTVAEVPFSATLSWRDNDHALASDNRLTAAGRDSAQTPWQAEFRVHLADGELAADGARLRVRNTHEMIVEISLGFGDKGKAAAECGRHRIANIDGWDQLVQQHVDSWRQHFGGLVGTVSGKDPAPFLADRLARLATGKSDPRLYFALWQIARYRLCSHFATAPQLPLPGHSWLGLVPSALPAYLSNNLPATENAAPIRAYYEQFFPGTEMPAPTAGGAADFLPSSPAQAIYAAALAGDQAALSASLDAYLLAQAGGWLLPPGRAGVEDAGILAAAFPAMLVQAAEKALVICPTLPESWSQGAVHGLLAPGGWTLSIEWSMSRPSKVVIAGKPAGHCELRNLPDEYTLVDDHDRPVSFEQDGDLIAFTAAAQQAYFLQRQKLR